MIVRVPGAFLDHSRTPKPPKIDAEIAFEKKLRKNFPKFEFDLHFCFPKPSQIASKSDAKRSLFRDVMEPARKSTQVNGTHHLYSVHTVRHMIRSTPSIQPAIHPSIHPSVSPSVRASVRPSVRPSFRPSINPSSHPSIH